MSIIDGQGRVFGRFNIIDAAVVAAVVVLAPIAYAAYVLFRPPVIVISGTEPAQIVEHVHPRVRIIGQHLRPYLRAQVGHEQPHEFLIASPTSGEFVMPDLPAGVYDLALFDEVERVAVKPRAITVVPITSAAQLTVRLTGAVVGLDEAEAHTIVAGRRYELSSTETVDVLSIDPPRPDIRTVLIGSSGRSVAVPVARKWQVPAVLRVPCTFVEQTPKCSVNTIVVAPGVPLPLGDGHSFVIADVRPDGSGQPVELLVRVIGRPEVVDQLKVGDRDALPRNGFEAGIVVSLRDRHATQAQVSTRIQLGAVEQTATTSERLAQVDAVIMVIADVWSDGLLYRGESLKTGSTFTFDAPAYLVRGQVLRITHVSREGGANP